MTHAGGHKAQTEQNAAAKAPSFWDMLKAEAMGKIVAAIVSATIAVLVIIGAAVWAYIQTLPGPLGLVPTNAVIAFSGDCPRAGWERYWPATSRVIVGAASAEEFRNHVTSGYSRTQSNQQLSVFGLAATAGDEKVALDARHLPAHQHATVLGTQGTAVYGNGPAVDGIFGYRPGNAATALTAVAGNNPTEPLSVLQPLIALTYCRKLP